MGRLSRRRFLKSGVAAAGATIHWPIARYAFAAPRPQLTKYLERLPLPGAGIVVATPSDTNTYSFLQREIARQLHPDLPATPLWAYDDGSGLASQAGSLGMAVL